MPLHNLRAHEKQGPYDTGGKTPTVLDDSGKEINGKRALPEPGSVRKLRDEGKEKRKNERTVRPR